MENYATKTKEELVAICKVHNLKGVSNKKKNELIDMLTNTITYEPVIAPVTAGNECVTSDPNKLTMIDLFAGTGAFTYAFEQTGKVECVFANDMVEWSKQIYDTNFHHHFYWVFCAVLNVRGCKTKLTERNYHITYKVLDTSEITGVPQHRERIYIVCIKSKEIYDQFTLDFPAIPKKNISSLLEQSVADKYYYTEKSSTWELVKNTVTKKDTVYQYRRVYVRENKSNECPTLTANMGGGGHNVPLIVDNKGIRKLTPRECFLFQGFPASYVLPTISDTNLYKLAGNAVSVPVVELIANRLIGLLTK